MVGIYFGNDASPIRGKEHRLPLKMELIVPYLRHWCSNKKPGPKDQVLG